MPDGTKLTKVQEVQYQKWRKKLPMALQYEGNYDLRGLWKSNPNIKPSVNLHFPDTYKLPNHPTFSNESIYFNERNKRLAGFWQETDSSFNYIPYNPAVKDTIVERKMPDGGKIPKYLSPNSGIQRVNFMEGFLPIPDEEVLKWTQEYINSPKYRQRLSNFYSDPSTVIKKRTNKVKDVEIVNNVNPQKYGPGVYNSATNRIVLNNDEIYKEPNDTRYGALAHELGHVTNAGLIPELRLNFDEEQYLFSKEKKFGKYIGKHLKEKALNKGISLSNLVTNELGQHDSTPRELKSDIDSFRFQLKKAGLYDAGTQDMNMEILNRAKQDVRLYNNFDFKRLQQHYTDEDLIDIMNNIATNTPTITPFADNGYKINNMPDNKKLVNSSTPAEKARAARILELSRQWNIPTSQIFSQVKMGPRQYGTDVYGNPRQQVESTRYYTFGNRGQVSNQITDYTEPLGVTQYTPADIQLQQQLPGRGITTNQIQVDANGVPVSQMVNSPQLPVVTQANMKWGGKMEAREGIHIKKENKGKFTQWAKRHKMSVQQAARHVMANKEDYAPHVIQMANFAKNFGGKKKKAQNGYSLPDPNNPYSFLDEQIAPLYQENLRLTALNDVQPLQTAQVPPISTELQAPLPSIPTRSLQSAPNANAGGRNRRGIQFGNINLNLGTAIAGLAGAANQAIQQANTATEAARNQRLTLMQENYNPFQYGTGSQAIFNNGGKVPDHVYDLKKQDIERLRKMGYIVEEIK